MSERDENDLQVGRASAAVRRLPTRLDLARDAVSEAALNWADAIVLAREVALGLADADGPEQGEDSAMSEFDAALRVFEETVRGALEAEELRKAFMAGAKHGKECDASHPCQCSEEAAYLRYPVRRSSAARSAATRSTNAADDSTGGGNG